MQGDFAFEDLKTLFLSAVDVCGRPAARRNESLPQGIPAVGIFAGGQEAVDIADDGDGAAFGGLPDGRVHSAFAPFHFPGSFPTNFRAR
jgi:hypothetical protein